MNADHENNESVSISTIKFVADSVATGRKLTEIELAALKELVFARFYSEKEAQHIAYVELQRRLDVLNHAHDNMVIERDHFLPREVHDSFYEEYKGWRDTVNSNLANSAGRIAAYVTVLGFLFMALQVFLHFWK